MSLFDSRYKNTCGSVAHRLNIFWRRVFSTTYSIISCLLHNANCLLTYSLLVCVYPIHYFLSILACKYFYFRLELILSHAAPMIALDVLIMASLTTCAVPEVVPRYVPLTRPSWNASDILVPNDGFACGAACCGKLDCTGCTLRGWTK